MSLLCELRI